MLFSKSFFLGTCFYFLSFLLNLNSGLVYAQQYSRQVQGEIADENGLLLPYAQVSLKRSIDSLLVKTILSDEKGHFVLEIPTIGKYFIEARMMGYENAYSSIFEALDKGSIELAVIQLKPQTRQLGTVNISGTLPFVERKADKIVVNLNGLGAGAPIMDVMNQLPGVTVTPDDRISLNGRGVQIYIDGKASTLSAEALSGLLKGISSSSIQKVELISQPSARYDAAGNGGIINIVRKRNYKAGLNGNVYGGGGKGSYGKANGGLNLNYKGKAYNLLLIMDYNYNRYFINNYISSTFSEAKQAIYNQSISDISSLRSNSNYTPSLGLDIYLSKRTTLSGSFKPGFQFFDKDATANIQNINQSGNVIERSHFLNLVDTRSTNLSSGLRLQYQIDTSGRELTIDADYYRYGNYNKQDNRSINLNDELNPISDVSTIFDQDRLFSVYALKMDYTHPLGKGRQLEMGMKSSYVLSDNSNFLLTSPVSGAVPNPAQTDLFSYQENISALYITYSRTGKKLSYQLGLRGEYTWGKGKEQENVPGFTRNYIQPFPSFHADYRLSKNHSLTLGANKRIERPGYENLNPLIRIISSNNLQQGNPDLRPVISYNAELYYGYKNAFFIGLNYSFSEHDFTSVTVPLGDGITSTKPGNADYSRYLALQMIYNKQIFPWWSTSSTMSISRRAFKGEVNGYLFDDNGLSSLSATSYNSFSLTKNFSFMFLFNHRGKSVERTITNEPYTMLTAGIRQSFLSKKAFLQLNFMDIFKSYRSAYQQNSGSVLQLWRNQYETRMIKLNFSYSFGGTIKNPRKSNSSEEEKRRTNLNEN